MVISMHCQRQPPDPSTSDHLVSVIEDCRLTGAHGALRRVEDDRRSTVVQAGVTRAAAGSCR